MLTGGDFTTLSGRLFQASMMTVLLKSTFSDRVWRVRLPCCCYRVGHITSQHCLRHCGRLKPVSRILGSFTHTRTCLTALFPGLPRWAGTRKVKPIWILLKQETVSGISWAVCKSAPCCRQTTTPAPHHSVFYRPDALPAAQPTVSKHWGLSLGKSSPPEANSTHLASVWCTSVTLVITLIICISSQ